MENVIMYSIGIMGHIGVAIVILGVWALLQDPRVKYLGGKITLKARIFVPFMILIVFYVWVFVG